MSRSRWRCSLDWVLASSVPCQKPHHWRNQGGHSACTKLRWKRYFKAQNGPKISDSLYAHSTWLNFYYSLSQKFCFREERLQVKKWQRKMSRRENAAVKLKGFAHSYKNFLWSHEVKCNFTLRNRTLSGTANKFFAVLPIKNRVNAISMFWVKFSFTEVGSVLPNFCCILYIRCIDFVHI